MAGFQSRERICHMMEDSDCFVLSSMHEGLGIVVQEAMHAGLPIVATNNGGQIDLIQEGRNGLLIDPGSPAALANAIRTIQADPGLAATMSRHNQNDIRRWYMENNSGLYLNVFTGLVRETKGALICEKSAVVGASGESPVTELPPVRKTRETHLT